MTSTAAVREDIEHVLPIRTGATVLRFAVHDSNRGSHKRVLNAIFPLQEMLPVFLLLSMLARILSVPWQSPYFVLQKVEQSCKFTQESLEYLFKHMEMTLHGSHLTSGDESFPWSCTPCCVTGGSRMTTSNHRECYWR